MKIARMLSQWNRKRLAKRHEHRLRHALSYQHWVELYASLTPEQEKALARQCQAMTDGPVFSIVVPVFNPDLAHLEAAVRSVQQQIYTRWELCLADDASTRPDVKRRLERLAASDPRIKCVYRDANGHISAASNSALELATGQFVALLDQDDLLPKHCLAVMAEAIQRHPEAQILYSDEDKINDKGVQHDPHFKPDWNELLFRSQNFLSHLGVYRRELVNKVGGFRVGFEGSQDHDLALRCVEQVRPDQIVHVPLVLYHWRVHAQSTAGGADAKPYALINGCKAVQEHLDRRGLNAQVTLERMYYRTRYPVPAHQPLVSIVIPTKDRPQLLDSCVRSVMSKTSYAAIEVLLVDNGTTDPQALSLLDEFAQDPRCRVLRDDSPFNYSQLNNRAVASSRGEYLCLMNNDIEVLQDDWLQEMLSVCALPDVGAVGARLYYPDGRLQHAGVILGIGGVAGHQFKNQAKENPHYMSRPMLVQELSVCTAACLLTPRQTFLDVGGLDEEHLKVAFNDVDYCMKVGASGRKVAYTPHAEFIHHESVSRGFEDSPEKVARFNSEADFMKRKWGDTLLKDPAYNPNLTLKSDDFSLAWPPRISLASYLGLPSSTASGMRNE
jgi:GT2 family glycosyltransferase